MVAGILHKIAQVFEKMAVMIQPLPTSIQQERVKPWFKINGDKTLRLDYDLNAQSLVFDLGGYEGQWASDIYGKYKCKIFIFEPYKVYADNIKQRFERNDDITVFCIGLSSKKQDSVLNISQDSSSLYRTTGSTAVIKLEEAFSFFSDHKIGRVDLMKINIEGGEFDLLDHLIDTGVITKIENIQVQFHDFVTDAANRMKAIRTLLARTHRCTFSYEFVWENWQRLKH